MSPSKIHHQPAVLELPKLDPHVAEAAAEQLNLLAAHASAHRVASKHVGAATLLQASAMPITLMAAAEPSVDIPAKPDRMDQFTAALMDAAKPPEQQVEAGRVPAGPFISLNPESPYLKEDRLKSYNALLGMNSLAQMYSVLLAQAARTKRGHPDPYNISNVVEATQEFADQADFMYQSMTIALAGFWTFSIGALNEVHINVRRTELHEGFIGQVFDGFNLDSGAVKALDTILTNFAKALGSIAIEQQSQTTTVNKAIVINTVPKLNITGEDDDTEYVYQPQCTLVYMKIDATSWKNSFSKFSGTAADEGFDFRMYFSTSKCLLNMDWYNKTLPKFDKIMAMATGKRLEEFGELLSHPVTVASQNEAVAK